MLFVKFEEILRKICRDFTAYYTEKRNP